MGENSPLNTIILSKFQRQKCETYKIKSIIYLLAIAPKNSSFWSYSYDFAKYMTNYPYFRP